MRHLLLHRYFGFCGSRECRRPTVDVDTIVMYTVDLGVTKESKMELGVVCDLSAPAVRLLCCPRNPLTLGHGSLLPFNLPLFHESGFARTTCAQSRGTRTLVRRDTSDSNLYSLIFACNPRFIRPKNNLPLFYSPTSISIGKTKSSKAVLLSNYIGFWRAGCR